MPGLQTAARFTEAPRGLPTARAPRVSSGRLLHLCPGIGWEQERDLGGLTENPAAPSPAWALRRGRGSETLFSPLSLESPGLAPPPELGSPPQPHSLTVHLTMFIEHRLCAGFYISSRGCLWKRRGAHSLALLPRCGGNLTSPSAPAQEHLTPVTIPPARPGLLPASPCIGQGSPEQERDVF